MIHKFYAMSANLKLSRLASYFWPKKNPERRLMKAESFARTFELAGERLVTDIPAELQAAAEFIGQLCHARDARVARFPW